MAEHLEYRVENREAAERQTLLGLFGGEMPSCIAVLSGGIVMNSRGAYKTPSYAETDIHGFITGGKARVIAGSEAARLFPDVAIVTNSHASADEPTHAEVIAEEMERFGVSSDRIVKQERSVNTVTEFVELIKLAAERGWTRLGIITNGYHVPRCAEMYRQLMEGTETCAHDPAFLDARKRFRDIGGTVAFVDAESILEARSPHYKTLIERAKNTDAYQERLRAEESGLADLKEGRYAFRWDM